MTEYRSGRRMIKKLEKYMSQKCEKCPFYYYDGFNSESDCLFEVYFNTNRFYNNFYSGCKLPLFILKILGWIIWKIDENRWKREKKEENRKQRKKNE